MQLCPALVALDEALPQRGIRAHWLSWRRTKGRWLGLRATDGSRFRRAHEAHSTLHVCCRARGTADDKVRRAHAFTPRLAAGARGVLTGDLAKNLAFRASRLWRLASCGEPNEFDAGAYRRLKMSGSSCATAGRWVSRRGTGAWTRKARKARRALPLLQIWHRRRPRARHTPRAASPRHAVRSPPGTRHRS